MQDNKKNKNPLFVVTNDGKDVEEATNFVDLWAKKLGLDPLYKMLEGLIESLLSAASTYPLLNAVCEIFNAILKDIDAVLKTLFPKAYTYRM